MTRLIRNAAFALSAVIAVAAPLAAGPIYLPIAFHEIDGAYERKTELWVSNPDVLTQGFVVRYITMLADGTVREDNDESTPYYVAPGASVRFTDLVPQGFKGSLEIDGAGILEFNGVLTSRNVQGTIVGEAEIPLLTQNDLVAAGADLHLLAWERSGTTTTTNLGIFNAGHSAARCTVGVRLRDGLLVVQGVGIDLEPLTVVHFDDALGSLGLTSVLDGARAVVNCNQPFWAFSSVYNDQTGAVEFNEPSSSILKSTLIEPVGDGGGGPVEPGAVVFRLPGVFLNCTPCDHHRYDMNTGGAVFRRIIMDFDVYVGNWDPRRPNGFHNVVWIQNGQSWSNLLGYLNSKGTQGRMTFQVNAGVGREASQNPGMNLGQDYHIRYEYDLIQHIVWYEISQNGTRRTRGEYAISQNVRTIRPSGFFAGFGGQSAPGPEAATRNWRFSNLVAQFVP